jgi:hypothetical protein
MFGIDPELLKAFGGPAGAVMFAVLIALLFALGIIRPRSAIREVREDRDARLAEYREQIQDLKEAYRISEEGRTADREISRQSLEVARTSEAAITGLRSALEQKGRVT